MQQQGRLGRGRKSEVGDREVLKNSAPHFAWVVRLLKDPLKLCILTQKDAHTCTKTGQVIPLSTNADPWDEKAFLV